MSGNAPLVVEQQDVPTIFADGSVRIEIGEIVRILYSLRRATEPTLADHVATIVMPRDAFLRCLAAAHAEMPEAMLQMVDGIPH